MTTSESQSKTNTWLSLPRFILLLCALLFVCHPLVLLGFRSFFFRDYGVLGYPLIHFARESFWQGEIPFWNPLSNCGTPFMAQWGTMALYPFSLIYLIFPLPWSLSFFSLAHLVLAGAGMYQLCHRWLNHPLPAFFAGMAYVFNGFTLSCLVWPNYTVALGWMPWVILVVGKAAHQGGTWIVWAAIISSFQMLSGVPEIVMLTWFILVILGLGAVIKMPRRLQVSTRFISIIVLTAGLTAVQLLPFYDLLNHSQRTMGVDGKWSMPVWGWANLLVPLFRCFQTPQGQFFQYGQEFINSYYIGLGVFVLGLWAAWKTRLLKTSLLGFLLLFSLIMALGSHTFLYDWFKTVFPVAGLVRYPVKFVVMAAFIMPLLAGYALYVLLNSPNLKKEGLSVSVFVLAVIILAGILLAYSRMHPLQYDQWDVTLKNTLVRIAIMIGVLSSVFWGILLYRKNMGASILPLAACASLLALDGVTHSPRLNPTLPASLFSPGLWKQAHTQTAPQYGQSRLMISPEGEQHLLRSQNADDEGNFLGKRMAEWSNLDLLDGIPKVNGAATLQIKEQMDVQKLLYSSTNMAMSGLMDFLGASLVTASNSAVEWEGRTSFMPLASGGQQPVFLPADEVLKQLANFNPRTTVFLGKEDESRVSVRNPVSVNIVPVSMRHNRLEWDVDSPAPSLFVIAQSHYHPWQAEVNGKSVSILRANHAFQALEIPWGKSHVTLIYQDFNFTCGASISIATLLICILLIIRIRRRKVSQNPVQQ